VPVDTFVGIDRYRPRRCGGGNRAVGVIGSATLRASSRWRLGAPQRSVLDDVLNATTCFLTSSPSGDYFYRLCHAIYGKKHPATAGVADVREGKAQIEEGRAAKGRGWLGYHTLSFLDNCLRRWRNDGERLFSLYFLARRHLSCGQFPCSCSKPHMAAPRASVRRKVRQQVLLLAFLTSLPIDQSTFKIIVRPSKTQIAGAL